jgi:general secretion pathway protein A
LKDAMIIEIKQRNFYQILGVEPSAAQHEIDHAYKRLIGRFDSAGSKRSPRIQATLKGKIALLQEAYDTLSNEEKREEHDRSIENPGKGDPASVSQEEDLPFNDWEISGEIKKNSGNIYEDYFGLSEKPFDLTPDPKYLYLSPKHKEVLAHLVYGIQENNGFLKIVGEVGTGKTMICRSFLRELHTDFSIAYIFNPGIDELELLQTINSELGLPAESTSKKKLTDVLNRFLLEERKKGHRVVVIIDEAQDLLPSVLEQLRLLSNLETETEKLIQIVLIGQPELDKVLAQEDLRQLKQRITIQWELLPLNLEETRGYIQHRLNVALGKGKVQLTRSGTHLIFRYAKGIPRMINVLADRSLLIAYTQNTKRIDCKIIRMAAKDIGGLKPTASPLGIVAKFVLPFLAVAALAVFIIHDFALPDLKTNPDRGRDIPTIIQENPIDLSNPGQLVSKQARVKPAPPKAVTSLETLDAMQKLEAVPPPKTTAHSGTLVLTQPEKLVTYLASLSLEESKLEAAKWILEAWGFDQSGAELVDNWALENLETEFDLSQYELNGNFKRLTNLNYPAILEVALPNSQGTKYLALISVKGDRGVFGSVDKIEMPLETINPLWTRKAIIIWKNFEFLPSSKLVSGYEGKEVVWLQKNLRLLGFFIGREVPRYGGQTEKAVRKFQRKNNIKDDGKFSTESIMLLYNLLDIYSTPKLMEP